MEDLLLHQISSMKLNANQKGSIELGENEKHQKQKQHNSYVKSDMDMNGILINRPLLK